MMGKNINELGGYTGKVLRVDLKNQRSTVEPLSATDAQRFIGGRGLAAKVLFDEVPSHVNPLEPENKLIFATGPVTGTIVPGSSRYVVVTKSPQTHLFLDTYAGGEFPAEMKYAGYDLIILEDKAGSPIYVWIDDNHVEFREASHLWGKFTHETEAMLKSEVGDESARVAAIGPAGENLSNLAILQNDYWHSCGRGGVGAVMGSKNLKAVVIRGSQGVKIAEPQALLDYIINTVNDKITNGPLAMVADGLSKFGTFSGIPSMNDSNVLTTRNFQEGQIRGAQHMDLDAIRRELGFRDVACTCCNIACNKHGRVKHGPYSGDSCGALQQETHSMMGSNLDIDSENFNIHVNALCDNLGLDSMGAGAVVGFAMECYERGLLTRKDLDGLDLRFGNKEAVVDILPMIAYRRGIGDLLAHGVKYASEKIGQGSEEFAMHVKGLAYAAYRPGPSSTAFALAYSVGDRGACHRRARPFMAERGMTPFTIEGKAKLYKDQYDERIPWHCALCCDLATCAVGLDFGDAAYMFSTVIGLEFNEEDMQTLADRVASLIRAYNVREGVKRSDDTLAPRSFRKEYTGPASGRTFTKEMLDTMLDEYYELRGWDSEGVPTPDTLAKLGLEDVADQIKKMNKQEG